MSSRISPIDGPPKHRRISADDPPSSDTGSTKAGEAPKAVAIEFAPVPPEITTYDSSSEFFAADIGICELDEGEDGPCTPSIAKDRGR
jgi:hypothetical protein